MYENEMTAAALDGVSMDKPWQPLLEAHMRPGMKTALLSAAIGALTVSAVGSAHAEDLPSGHNHESRPAQPGSPTTATPTIRSTSRSITARSTSAGSKKPAGPPPSPKYRYRRMLCAANPSLPPVVTRQLVVRPLRAGQPPQPLRKPRHAILR